jgi:hypothetical protein
MMTVTRDRIPEAKTIIREFRQKMCALMESSCGEEVYQLAIQFYPMTILPMVPVKEKA